MRAIVRKHGVRDIGNPEKFLNRWSYWHRIVLLSQTKHKERQRDPSGDWGLEMQR
jgi:hypothetical protein